MWVQARTRTLAAPAFGDHSRILPASMILPNEEVPAATVWGGIPGESSVGVGGGWGGWGGRWVGAAAGWCSGCCRCLCLCSSPSWGGEMGWGVAWQGVLGATVLGLCLVL